MTHALRQDAAPVAASYQQESGDVHPHAPAGSSAGGQFTTTDGQGGPKKSGRRRPARRHSGQKHDDGTMSYDPNSNHGTGYDNPDGDPRVHKLQDALNRLGLTDAAGHKLKLDGKLGPRTTAAVKKAQKALGLPQDGKVTPALLEKLATAKTLHAAADSSMPYGDVTYADPGYQGDGKKRYPLDSEEHCRAAWSYINMPANAAKYTAEQVASIKAKIKAAGRKYGIDFASDVKASSAGTLRDVELARPGDWKLESGDVTFTAQMLQDASDFFAASGGQAVPVKLGHSDNRFNGDGEPAFGSVTNVRYTEDDRGPVLLGDIVDMPEWLGAAAPKRWPNRSIEGWRNFSYDGREYSLILSGLAFLGVTPPGVRNIKSLADLQVALAASSAIRVVASAPLDDPAEPPPDDEDLDDEDESEEDEELDEEPDDEPSASPTPAHPAGVSHVAAQAAARIHNAPVRGAGRMDRAKIREALGLAADASDEEVGMAFVAAGFAPPDPTPQAIEPSQQLAEVAASAGAVVLDAGVWKQAQEQIALGVQAASRLREQERETLLLGAVKDGRIPPASRAHWAALWDRDPKGTTAIVASLKRNLVPIEASGYDTDADEDRLDAEFAHLFPPAVKEARRG